MRRSRLFKIRIVLLLLMAAVVMAPSLGCVGLGSHLMYIFRGLPKEPAKYEGLINSRVAVVCVSDSSTDGRDSVNYLLARQTGRILDNEVRGIDVVSYEEVEDWIDNNDWNRSSFRNIGKAVKADMVVAIEMGDFRIRDGSTLYRGRSDLHVKVYDMKRGGKIPFEISLPEIAFPQSHGIPVTDRKESQFRQDFITILAEDVARLFYAYERREDFGRSAAVMR